MQYGIGYPGHVSKNLHGDTGDVVPVAVAVVVVVVTPLPGAAVVAAGKKVAFHCAFGPQLVVQRVSGSSP